MTLNLASEIRAYLERHATTEIGKNHAISAYTGSGNRHYGVRVPALRDFITQWTKANPLIYPAWIDTLDQLYHGQSLEEKLCAGILLAQSRTLRRQLPLAQLERWLDLLEGWNEVDTSCQSTFTAAEVLADWPAWSDLLGRLALDPNINKQRASLVLLILPLRSSSDKRLWEQAHNNLLVLQSAKDKRITKAISWILRESSKLHRASVEAYLAVNGAKLPSFVIREVEKKMQTGKK